MPKMKSKRGASKRFKFTGTGKIKRSRSHAGHFLTKKSPKRKRRLRSSALVSKPDVKRISRWISK